MGMPRNPDQDDDAPVNKASSAKTNAIIAMVVALVIVFVALHLAGAFGP
jgi:hypothetical protein